MGDLAPVDRHRQRSSPGRCYSGHDEARYLVRDSSPAGSVSDELLQIEPAVEGNLDGVADLSPSEPTKHIFPEKRAIHAKTNLAPGHREGRQLVPQFSQKTQRGLAVMHVPRAIAHPQHMRRLSKVRHDRVVARNLSAMRVVAALGSLDLKSRRHDRPVNVDRQGAQTEPRQHLCNHRGIERHQMLDTLHREALEPSARRSRRRPGLNSSETVQQWVGGEILQMLEPAAADHEQPDQHADHGDGTEVSTEACLAKRRPDQVVETDLSQVPIEQLQSRVRSELYVGELKSKIPVDTSMQFGFSSSHSQWPFVCWKKTCVVTRFQPQRRAFFNSYAAATSNVLSD